MRRWSATDRTAARRAGRIGSVADVDLHRRDASHGFDGFAGLSREGSGVISCEHKRERDGTGLIDVEIAHHVRRQHVAAIPRIANAAERLLDVCLEIVRAHEDWPPPPRLPLDKNRRAALSTLSSTSAIVPANDAPAAR